MKTVTMLLVMASATACITRAPTTYELDRRAGLLADAKDDPLPSIHTSSAVPRAPRMPVQIPPLIEKVWVSDLPIGEGARLQGTWIFLEVERGRWLDEVDPGGAPLLEPALGKPAARAIPLPPPPAMGPPAAAPRDVLGLTVSADR